MKPDWTGLADSLRGEIAEYGRLLSLIEEQQKLIFQRDPEAILRQNPALQAQIAVLHQCREARERAVSAFAAAHGRPAGSTMRALLPSVGEEGRPLVAALIAETNHLIHRVRRQMALNQRLLATSLDCQQEFMRRLWPSAFTKTYAKDGRVSVARLRSEPSLSSAG
ncbi:MAG TPA: flagellar protein FlgN [Opitutaceae bacterium]|nr:flagellar protein FlgN [Opitutaceae bacterium]